MKVKLGIIGLGEVAQIIHLPILQSMREQFEITAICDVSRKLTDAISGQYGITRCYLSAGELIADPDVEAVFVLNSDEYHADCIIGAANHGKHVFVEKPMCLNVADAHRVIAAKNAGGVRVMVGYMRRYAPAYIQAVEEVKQLGKINYARIRDMIGPNSFFIDQSANVLRFQDIPTELAEDRLSRGREQVEAAIGTELAGRFYSTYRLMGGLCSHDLSAMREMLGMPLGVIAATRWNNGQFLNAVLKYEGYHILYETGVDRQGRFDASIEVMGDSKTIRVNYDTPYIRHLPTTLTICETQGEAYTETITRPSFTDPYTVELRHFHEVITHGGELKSTPEDFLQDLQLFRLLIEAMAMSENNS